MNRMKLGVGVAGGLLLAVWIRIHLDRLINDPEGLIRLVLGLFFTAWILFRSKVPAADEESDAGVANLKVRVPLPVIGGVAALLALLGIILPVHQFEWLGIILLLYACFRWAMPAGWGRDVRTSMFILYWVHPLPTQLFGGFELFLQKVSIRGSEWLLHVINVPAWADGLILNTGYITFGVPESCSGAMTAVAVLMCVLGLGVILRFRWYGTLILAVLGLVQVLILNIVRITIMVFFGRSMPQAWADNVLHDTLGTLLLIAIALIHAEAFVWRKRNPKVEKPYGFLPKSWKQFVDITPKVILLLILIGLFSYAAYRRRPSREAALITQVVPGLRTFDSAAALRAARKAERLAPDNPDYRALRLGIMLDRKHYTAVLEEISALATPTVTEIVMKAQALTALDRVEEAYSYLRELPPAANAWPAVAMIRSEYAAFKDDVDEVRRRIVVASKDGRNVDRVRAIFPLLARYEQWKTIADAESTNPHRVLNEALIGLRAQLQVESFDAADGALSRALATWPNDPRVFNMAHALATKRPKSRWGDLFADKALANLDKLDVALLGLYIDYGFDVGRADLSWVAYKRLLEVDPDDPALFIGVAQNAQGWLRFGLEKDNDTAGGRPSEEIVRRQKQLADYLARWGSIPLEAELREGDPDVIRKRYVALALQELDRRRALGPLEERMELLYPKALILAERFDEARVRLDGIAERYPHLRLDVWLQVAQLLAREDRWQDAYEKVRVLFDTDRRPSLEISLLMLNACTELRLGLMAMEVAAKTRRYFPDAPQSQIGQAVAWLAVGDGAQALFVMESEEGWVPFPGLPQLLYDSGRLREGERLARLLGKTLRTSSKGNQQPIDLAPAERILDAPLPPAPPPEVWARGAGELQKSADAATSPFLKAMRHREAAWYQGTDQAGSVEAWEAVGRDAAEKATALQQLAILMVQSGQETNATVVLRRALGHLPEAAGIWRLLAALEKNEATLAEAGKRCPNDSVIWMMNLVTRVRSGGAAKNDEITNWTLKEARRATAGRLYSVEALVQAGTFLIRQGLNEPAGILAREAVRQARGLLPAHALEVRCAIGAQDAPWALSSAHRAIDVASDPEPFFRTIAYIKLDFGIADADAIRAFTYLAEHSDQKLAWAERLGIAFFRQGEYRRSAEVLRKVAADPASINQVNAALLAAESDRLLGEAQRNLRALRVAYLQHADRLDTINNLVYALAQDPKTLPEAIALLPTLIERGGDVYQALDTIAVVYLRSGNVAKALEYTGKAIAKVPSEGYIAAEAYMNAAEIYYEAGERGEARRLVETARARHKLPPEIDRRALQILWRIQREQ